MVWFKLSKIFGKRGAAKVEEQVHDVERSVKASIREIIAMLPDMPAPDVAQLYEAVRARMDRISLGGK